MGVIWSWRSLAEPTGGPDLLHHDDDRLTIQAGHDPNWYPTGVHVTDAELRAVPLSPHDWHGDWNYTIDAQSHVA